MLKFTDDQLDVQVLHFLKQHRGKANPIGRWELVVKVFGVGADYPRNDSNTSDREIRESVKRLRRAGALICDMGDGRGRFIAETFDEAWSFHAFFGSGVWEKMETMRAIDAAMAAEFPVEYAESKHAQEQPSMFDMRSLVARKEA